MSRPPHAHSGRSPGGEQAGDLQRLDYLPLEYADLVALQEELAVTRMGRPRDVARANQEPDAAQTFMEMSALVAHVLSVYQRHHAGEAFISTAQAPSSLVRHGHRLAYDPDPGLAASGYAVLFAKERVSGVIREGLGLASVPLGEIKAQDFETGEDLAVDAALNELLPADALGPVTVTSGERSLRLQGTGYGLQAGDLVALVGSLWQGFRVTEVEERVSETIVGLDDAVGGMVDFDSPSGPPVLLARPSRRLSLFGSSADPALFPPDSVRNAPNTMPSSVPRYWYTVQRADSVTSGANDVYLSELAADPLIGSYVVYRKGTDWVVLRVTAEVPAAVTLNREVAQSFTSHTVRLNPVTGGGFTTELVPAVITQNAANHVSGNVTAIQVSNPGGLRPRSTHPVPGEWLAGWRVEAPLARLEPNPAALTEPLVLDGLLSALVPARPLVFSNLEGTRAQVVSIRRVDLNTAAGVTEVYWDPISPAPAGGWILGDLKIYGNVARVSHGRTVNETLGGSDGVSAFQRFELGELPLTVLPSASGGEPELEIRVDGVLWQRVQDFALSGPTDRHYRSVSDEAHVTSIVFGDGRNGAVPPSGRKNVVARYRVGLGRAGDVDPGRLSRLKRAHPLLDRAMNVTAVSGGAEPASPQAIRTQSPLWIRTFDRAVSVSDLADLALTMPGIARAGARWNQAEGVVLVVATSAGEAPPALDAIRAFLDGRRDVSVPLVLRGPSPLDLFLDVEIEPDPAYLLELVKRAVRQALHGEDEGSPGMFTFPARRLGQPAYLSEVYGRLEAVPGVIGVVVTGFRVSRPVSIADVIQAGVDEWVRLLPQNLNLTESAQVAVR